MEQPLTIDTDQETVDRWLADGGRWEQFTPGHYADDLATRVRQMMQQHGIPQGTTGNERPVTGAPMLPPADWEPQPCETCGSGQPDAPWIQNCPDCKGSGVQRLAVTVPHVHTRRCRGLDCLPDRITVAWATVEWGPLPVVADGPVPEGDCLILRNDGKQMLLWQNRRGVRRIPLDLPPGVDRASLGPIPDQREDRMTDATQPPTIVTDLTHIKNAQWCVTHSAPVFAGRSECAYSRATVHAPRCRLADLFHGRVALEAASLIGQWARGGSIEPTNKETP